MSRQFTLEGKIYNTDDLSDKSLFIYEKLVFTFRSIENMNAEHALMTRARNAYLEDLKTEVVQKKSGVNIDTLFEDD